MTSNRFDRALNTDTLLKSATRRKYFVEGPGNRYGWYMLSRKGHRVMAAKGRSPGFTAELDRFPDNDVTIILLTNSYSTVPQDPIAGDIAAIVFGQPTSPSSPIRAANLPPSLLASYAGNYQYGPDYFDPNAKFTLTAKPGFLLMEIGEQHMPLVPLSQADFLERQFFGRVVMSTDAGGKVSGLTCRYGDKTFAARRLESLTFPFHAPFGMRSWRKVWRASTTGFPIPGGLLSASALSRILPMLSGCYGYRICDTDSKQHRTHAISWNRKVNGCA